MKEQLKKRFVEIFGEGDEVRVFFSPGRVNLIGEHTDYNGGHVFPCALTIGTYGAVRKNGTDTLRFFSDNFKDAGMISVPLKGLKNTKEDGWTNYPKGVIETFRLHSMEITEGFDLLIYGNIPNSSGLSSSASLEVLTATILKTLYGFDVDGVEISKLTQQSENQFNGVNCGIMDQFAIAMGKKDHAIFLDTATLEYEYAPLIMPGKKIVIACTNKKRGLADSKYNERRSQCETALADIQKVKPIKNLGELSEAEFEEVKGAISDPVNCRRAKHAVYENQRTIQAVEALKNNDLETFGKLMNASHVSLRDDYEVTGIELDTLVEEAWKQKGVVGSRMTGAGFGGCTVSIVADEDVDAFVENVGKAYLEKIGYAADFYVVEVGSGPIEL